eukprot:NODE_2366_length_2228_cov_4.734888.p1 GENE.NODE_2366_length_2228_cov_4.734888~~NODE_2366_length_2228_cov_4.734888.p1  ORF type:complete len:664 (+),score=262.97 NODE_2366_length_2228_cov_4.734888:86-2077(+)
MAAIAIMFLTLLASASAGDGNTSPLQKVMQLLSEMDAKITKEGDASTATQKEVEEFCRSRSADLTHEVATAKAGVQDLKASIEQLSATIVGLNDNVEDYTANVANNEADLKAAMEVRAREHGDFVAEERDTLSIISALERAISILEREAAQAKFAGVQIKNADGLIQALSTMVGASMLQAQDAAQLTAFVQGGDTGAPDAATYQTHGTAILDVLADLLEKARQQLKTGRSEETAALHNFNMLGLSLNDAIRVNNKDIDEAKTGITTAKGQNAAANSDLDMTKTQLKASSEALATLGDECDTKKRDYDAEMKSRGEEVAALTHAKKAISEMTTGAEALHYDAAAASFMQCASAESKHSGHADVAHFLKQLAEKQHSKVLAQLAKRIVSTMREASTEGQDPFAKVKGLISDLIARLEKEAASDASHKAYCDKEIRKTKEKKDSTEAMDKKLANAIDTMLSTSATLKEQVAALQASLAALAKTQVEMDKLRKEESAEYQASKADMEQGIEGVKIALKVLREYYASSGKAHAAATGSGSSIIGMLEVVASDFAEGLAERTAAETDAQADYEKGTQENTVETTAKEQDVMYKNKELTELAASLATEKSYRQGTSSELTAILEYQGKLDEMCMPKAETYAEKKARADAEIAGLKQALAILEGAASLAQA